MNDFTIIRRSLFARFFSTVVTVLMVATAVGMLLVLLSLKDAGRRAFRQGSGNMHMLVSRDSNPLTAVLNGVFYARAPRAPIPWTEYERIAGDYPWEFAVPIQQGDSWRGFPVLATTPEFFTRFRPHEERAWSFAGGRGLEGEFEVVVGAAAAREGGLSVGSHLHLTHGVGAEGDGDHGGAHVHDEFEFTVVGILETTGGPHDRALFVDLDGAWLIHAHDKHLREGGGHVDSVADLTDADRLVTGMYLRLPTRAGSSLSGMQQQVFDELRRDPSVTVADPRQEVERLFTIVSNVDDILLAMAIVVMCSSGVAILLALYNSMEMRRRQIAVLRVLGCSRGRVFGLIMTESAVIAIVGAIVGAGLGLGGAIVAATVMKERLGLVVEPRLPVEAVATVLVGAVVLAVAAGVIPSIMAYRTAVVRNLRPLA
ncbi:MAG: ABC transporter permease [Planctomycetota bacterium]|jgi:putative ABC transport system permease protein